MSRENTQSLDFIVLKQGKDKEFKAQLQRVYRALIVKPMTMKEIDVCTGVMRENICRYISTLMEQNKIAIIKQRKCTITGFSRVNEYTADPDLFPQSNQLKLF